MPNYSYEFSKPSTNERRLELYDNKLIGHIDSDIKYSSSGKSIRIMSVFIDEEYRGKKLCRPFMIEFIKKIQDDNPDMISLDNVGGIPSAKCYLHAFKDSGYTAYDTYYRQTILNNERCSIEDGCTDMYFFKGGKRRRRHRTRKSLRIQYPMKSRRHNRSYFS